MQPKDFANLSPPLWRAPIAPAKVGYFHRISGHSPNPRALVTHWPSRVDVADVPLTKCLVSCFRMFASLMRSSIPPPGVNLLNTDYPEYLWLSVKDLTTQMREFITNELDVTVGGLVERIANHIQVTAVRGFLRGLRQRTRKPFCRSSMPNGTVQGTTPAITLAWINIWSAMYAA